MQVGIGFTVNLVARVAQGDEDGFVVVLVGVVEAAAARIQFDFAAEEFAKVIVDVGNHLRLQLQQFTAGGEIHGVLGNVIKVIHN